jgi:signal peptidase I
MESDKQASRTGSAAREFMETVVLTLVTYFLVRTFLFETYRVVGQSMDPTLEQDERLIVSKLSYRLHEPQRGDIIVFHDPQDPGRNLIKRVIGLPGETLRIDQGQVYINERLIQEPYIESYSPYSQPPTPIPDGQYFVMGDNRNNSSDSRSWGTLPRDDIVGKAAFTYWPLRLWGPVAHYTYDEAN